MFFLPRVQHGTQEIVKPIHAVEELYMNFYLSDKARILEVFGEKNGFSNHAMAICKTKLFGMLTFAKGIARISGFNRIFSIQFKANGFYKIFGIPQKELTDEVYEASSVFNCIDTELYEQLQDAKSLDKLVAYAEQFLKVHLHKSKARDYNMRIEKVTNTLLAYSGNISLEELLKMANMSRRTFERNFIYQVGVSPKVFARLVRFNHALDLKTRNLHEDWTSIAHKCAYFDQAHFIRDFKEFAGVTPSSFFKNTPPPPESVIKE
jgi:AraC-like DNA-binding protein